MTLTDKQRAWFRYFVDYLAILSFFVTYFVSGRDMMKASGALVVGSLVALALAFLVERRIAWLAAFAAVAGIVFGGLALAFHDPRFVKIKATAINGALGSLLLGGLALGKNPLKLLLGEAVKMQPDGWKKLTFRFGLFYLAMAGLNEIVWRNLPESQWIWFRFPGLQILTLIFSLLQAPLFMKYAEADEEAPPPPPMG